MRGEVGDDPKDFGRRRLEFFRSELPNYEAISEESPELKRFLPADVRG